MKKVMLVALALSSIGLAAQANARGFGGGFGGPRSTCQILNQSGSLFDGCGAPSEWRCYADVRFSNGEQRKIRGGCTTNLGACFSTGNMAVFPGCRE